MKSIVHILTAGFLMFLATTAQGQVVLKYQVSATNTSPSVTGMPNDVVTLDFWATSGFTTMRSVQFPMLFDSTVLQLQSVTSGLPSFKTPLQIDPAGNNVYLANKGMLIVSWDAGFAQFPTGYSPAGGKVRILTLTFKILSGCTSTVKLVPMPPLRPVEFATDNGQLTADYTQNGSVSGGNCPPPPETYVGTKIIANNIYIPQGEIGCMPIKVNEFTGVSTALFALNWDPLVLDFQTVRNYGLPGMDASTFAANKPGRLAVNWGTPNGQPISLTNLAPIFEVCFKAKGTAGAFTLVTPNGNGFPGGTNAEIAKSNGTNLWNDAMTPIIDTAYIVANPAPQGSVLFSAEKDTVAANLTTCVDVRTKNFNGLGYAEFAMLYDTTKLKYQNITLGPGATTLGVVKGTDLTSAPTGIVSNTVQFVAVEQNFGVGDTMRYIQFAYTGPLGKTLTDNTVLFSVCFKAIGPVSPTPTEIKISSLASLTAGISVPIGASKPTVVKGVPVLRENGHVVIKSALSATVSATNPTCNAGTNGSISVTTAANVCAGTLSYNWDGPGITAANKTVASPTGLKAGVYTVTVTCSAGPVTTTASATLTEPTAVAFSVAPAVVNATCNGGQEGTITIAMTGGSAPYSYAWTGPTGFNSVNSPSLTMLRAGNYKVTVTDAKNCTFVNNNNNIVVGQPSPISVQGNPTPVKCFNGSDGAISITLGGGTSPYTVAWTGPNGPAGTGTTISNLKGGLYSPVVTDSKGCTQGPPQPINVQTPAQGISVANSVTSNVICLGTNTGQAAASVATGGTPPFNYLWRNTQTNATANPLALGCGTYNVTVTDNLGCTASGTPVTVQCPTAALTASVTDKKDATCGNTGSISLSVSGGWNNPTVSWTGPNGYTGSGSNITGLGSGTYTATVMDQGGCNTLTPLLQPIVVGGPPAFKIDSTVTHVTCFGAANGAISITPSGGAGGPYTVLWNGTLQGATISNLTPGTYAPVVKDQAGCTQTFNAITVTGPNAIAVTDTTVQMQTGVADNGKIDLIGITGGTAPYTFSWVGPNNFSAATEDIEKLAPGLYTVTIKDKNDCGFSATYEIIADNPLLKTTAKMKKGACGTSADGCITIENVPGTAPGPYTITWTGAATGFTTTSTMPADLCGFVKGLYTIKIEDNAGHSFTLPTPVDVTGLDAPMVGNTNGAPNEDKKDGFILLSPVPATAPLSYKWNTGATIGALVQLDSGTYVVTVTHQISGCTSVYSYHLDRKFPKEEFKWVKVTNPKCLGGTDGLIEIQFSGADGPNYKYKWAGPNGVIAGATSTSTLNLGAGAYTVTVTDERGLTFVYDTLLTTQSKLAITNVNELSNINGFQVSGATVCDGVCSVAFSGQSGAASIAWSNGVTTASNSTLCGGAYSVTVTDALGCSSVWTDALTAPAGVTAIGIVSKEITCHDACDGKARITVSGGVPPYKVLWSNGQSDDIVTPNGFSESIELCGGEYKITVTDKNLITSTYVIPLTEPAPVSLTFAKQEPTNFTTCNGEIIATAEGTNGITTWTWAVTNRPGKKGNEQRADGLCAGEAVQFLVVDANGCSATGIDTVPYPPDGCLKTGSVVTPNGDNLNDFFGITCIQTVTNTLEIYNRWGQLVFSEKGYDSAPGLKGSVYWEGTSNGQELPDGAYFYILNYTDEEGNEQQIKGYVTLLR